MIKTDIFRERIDKTPSRGIDNGFIWGYFFQIDTKEIKTVDAAVDDIEDDTENFGNVELTALGMLL